MIVFLAGAENKQAAEVLQWAKVPHILMSYYYLRGRKDEDVIKLIEGYKKSGVKMMMLDSGAHSFFAEEGIGASSVKKETKTKGSVEEYLHKYVSWLKKYGKFFDIVVELDVGAIVGLDKVEEWREDLYKIVGDNLMPGFHPDYMDSAYLNKLSKNYEYIGIGVGHKHKIGEWNSYLNVVKKHKTKVHGFAMTKLDFMTKLPLFSVDSTSWKVGSKYGQMYYFRGGKMQMIGKEDRRRMIGWFSQNNIDWEKIKAEDYTEVDRANALTWVQYEKHIDARSKKYWKEEKMPTKEQKNNEETEKKDRRYGNQYARSPEFEKNKGKIMEIRQDPKIEQKRIDAVRKVSTGKMFRFKHGGRASNLPLYCNGCYARDRCKWSPFNSEGDLYDKDVAEAESPPSIYCALREEFTAFFKPEQFNLRDRESVDEMKKNLMSIQMTRAAMNYYFELLDGGIQDKSLTNLLNWIYERLDHVPNLEINLEKNVLHQTAREIRGEFTKKQKDLLLNALKAENAKEAVFTEKKNAKNKEKKKKSSV